MLGFSIFFVCVIERECAGALVRLCARVRVRVRVRVCVCVCVCAGLCVHST